METILTIVQWVLGAILAYYAIGAIAVTVIFLVIWKSLK